MLHRVSEPYDLLNGALGRALLKQKHSPCHCFVILLPFTLSPSVLYGSRVEF